MATSIDVRALGVVAGHRGLSAVVEAEARVLQLPESNADLEQMVAQLKDSLRTVCDQYSYFLSETLNYAENRFGHRNTTQSAADNLRALNSLVPAHMDNVINARDDWGLHSDSDSSEGDDE